MNVSKDPGVLNAIDQAERIGDVAVADLLRREAKALDFKTPEQHDEEE